MSDLEKCFWCNAEIPERPHKGFCCLDHLDQYEREQMRRRQSVNKTGSIVWCDICRNCNIPFPTGESCPHCDSMPLPSASGILKAGAGHLDDRAATYDQPSGERSMGKAVAAFNALTGHLLSEEQGWLFMTVLKAARTQQGGHRLDNYEDGAAYFALAGEAAAFEASNRPGEEEG